MKSQLLNLRPLHRLFPLLQSLPTPGLRHCRWRHPRNRSRTVWARQGAIMMLYPSSGRKGSYISLFWSIFNRGGVIGRLIPFILNYNRSEAVSMNDSTYIGFMCFMSTGTVLTLAILHPSLMVRDDGSHCTNIKYSNVSTEAIEILKLFRNWKMLLMVPTTWASTRPRLAPPPRGTGMGSH